MMFRLGGGILVCLFLALAAGCYHLRLEPAALPVQRAVTARAATDVFDRVRDVLVQDGYAVERSERRDNGEGGVITCGYRHFSTRAGGISQPVGGRLYYHRLMITVNGGEEGAEILMESTGLEIRSSYVYEEGGAVRSFAKRYPYEQYPGMFDLKAVDRELARVRGMLEAALRQGER